RPGDPAGRPGWRAPLRGGPARATTTVATGFRRMTPDRDLILYLFGIPGRHRFGSCGTTWYAASAEGVPVDTRKPAGGHPRWDAPSRPARPGPPPVPRCLPHAEDEVGEVMTPPPHIPIMRIDARSGEAVKAVSTTPVAPALATRAVYGESGSLLPDLPTDHRPRRGRVPFEGVDHPPDEGAWKGTQWVSQTLSQG